MEHRRQKHETWVSVPQFGGWDLRGDVPGYLDEFSEISETRKQNKRDASRANVGNGADLSLSVTSSKARPKGVVSSASKGKPSQAERNNGMSSELEKKKPKNPAQKVEPTNARPKGEASSGRKSKPADSRPGDEASFASKGKPNQAKPGGGVSSGPKSETAKPKHRGGVSSPLNIGPTKARPSGRVSSRSKNKPSTTVSRLRSSSIFSYFNCCPKP